MQLKQELNVDESTRPLIHLKRKLAKASQWAVELQTLCAAVGDTKTALEAEAYSTMMTANWHLEANRLKESLKKFLVAK
jgi:hypothetical protein